jgi:hypothetical protein
MSALPTTCTAKYRRALGRLLRHYGLCIEWVRDGTAIAGSYWGQPEAGLIGNRLFVRDDTPLHSALHEACHFICMDSQRRTALHTDAGGDFAEENAVCYLQGVLADQLPDYDRDRLFAEMDAWGYTFRLGSAAAWFTGDAADARDWLQRHALIDPLNRPTGRCRS